MLRALSLSVPPDARNGLAQQRLATVAGTVEDLFNAVTIVNPGGSYTLATEHSPLPLALRNDLPVPIRVRLTGRRPAGHDGHRPGRDRAAAGLPAAAGADRGALHAAGGRRRRAAHRRRAAARRAGAAVGALQRLRQGAVLHHAVGGCGAGRCSPVAGCGTDSAASPTAPTWIGPIRRSTVATGQRATSQQGALRPAKSGSNEQHRPAVGPAQPPFDRSGGPTGPPPTRPPRSAARDGYPRRPGGAAAVPAAAAHPRGPRRGAELAAGASDAAVVSRSWGMAVATLVSRITGFIRIVLLAAILGAALSSAFSWPTSCPT